MKVSPHTHCESFLTGSASESFVLKAKELGRTHIACTDLGHMSSVLKMYRQTKDANLKFIPGVEIYFKDNICDIVSSSKANRCKYFTVTIHCQDQEAYQELCKVVSSKLPTTMIREESQQLWSWNELIHLSKFNVTITLSGIHDIVGKLMLSGHIDLAETVFCKLKDIFGDKLYVAIMCEPWTKKWSQLIEIQYSDGSKDILMAKDTVTTDKARRIKAMDLIEKTHHSTIEAKYANNIYFEVNKNISKVILHKGFLPLPFDISFKVNRFLKALAKRHNIVILATDYAFYANKEDKIVQTMVLEGKDKIHANLHMKSELEIYNYLHNIMALNSLEISEIVNNNSKWASTFDNFDLKYEWRMAKVDGDPLKIAMEIIKENGRMKWDNPKWIARLREELEVIAKNPIKDLTPYFLPIRNVLNNYKENGLLVGPGRGSAGGSLFCYLLGITQIDPFAYDLPFSRFFSLDRIMMNELPDIDVDLEDRTLLVGEDGKSGYLYEKYGDKAAQISTRTTVRLKSAIKDVNRYFNGKVESSIELLTEGLPAPPQGISDQRFLFGYEDDDDIHVPGLLEVSNELKYYIKTKPKEWSIVQKAIGLTRSFSRHASAFVLSDVPISDIAPTKDKNVTQYSAKECEFAGLIKMDFLVIHQLKDIRVCLDLINKKNDNKMSVGYFNHNGNLSYIWDLPQIPEVFKSIWNGDTTTLFQINTRSMTPFVMEILPQNMMDIATVQALVRPGPMDFIDPNTGRNMVEEYMLRRKGQSEPDIKELADLLPETYGILCFQEQLTKIGKDLAGFSGSEAEKLRKHMAKKNMEKLMHMKPAFVEGALKKVSRDTAEAIWDRMVTFGRYGFSVIHAVEYAHITYACMFLKHFYPLEWWASVLTNAEEKEITGILWPYVKEMVLPPDINLSSDIMTVDYEKKKIRSKLGIIRGIGDKTIEPIVNNRPYTDIMDFVEKDVAGSSLSHKLIHVGILDSLFPKNMRLEEKLKMYEDCVQRNLFKQKQEEATKLGKKIRATQPKIGQIPQEYVNLSPLKDAAMRKTVLPSMPIDLHSLGKKYSKVLNTEKDKPTVISSRGFDTILINGETLRRLDALPGEKIDKDRYVASTCFVIDAKEFSYAKGTKRALKLILDSDGYISEKVLWPDYETGELMYPKDLGKGSICTFFFRKRAGKKDMNIMSVTIET